MHIKDQQFKCPAIVAQAKPHRNLKSFPVGHIGEWMDLVEGRYAVLFADGRRFDPREFPDLFMHLKDEKTPNVEPRS